MNKNLADILLSLRPGAKFVTRGNVDIEWFDDEQTQPTQAEIDAERVRLQAEYDSQAYARNRQAEYPPIGDQLDALFHAGVFPADMAAKLQAVKDTYPND